MSRFNVPALIVGTCVSVVALETVGVPAVELAVISAGCLGVGITAKKWVARAAPIEPPVIITDEDLRREILEREHRMQVRLNSAYRNISRFLYAAMYHAMARANTTDHNQLYAIAKGVHSELNAPFTEVHDVPLEAVIRFCLKHKCLPSPLPENWLEYAPQLAEMAQNMGTTSLASDVSADDSTDQSHVSGTISDVSSDVSTPTNVIPMGHTLPLLAAMGELKSELGDKARPAYALYGKWCANLTNDLLKVRTGRDWVKQHASDLTQKQADTLLKVFKLKAVKVGLLVPNPAYTGKPPHPEYIIAQQKPATSGSVESYQKTQC